MYPYSTKPEHVATILSNKGAMKLRLGPGLDQQTWDALFGAGAYDAYNDNKPIRQEEAWRLQGWYRKAADVRGKALSTLPWAIYREGNEDPIWRDTDRDVPDELEVLSGMRTAFYLSECALSLVGQFYFGKLLTEKGRRVRGSLLGRTEALQWWHPLTIKPKRRQGETYFIRRVNGSIVQVEAESVLWGWQPDPFVEWGPGSADGLAGSVGASVLNSMSTFLRNHLDSGLVKLTVLSVEGHRDPQQRADLRSIWARILRKGADVDGPPILTERVVPHTIGEGLESLSDTELTSEQRQAISTAFGIPWSILTSESANFATAQVEERGFYLRTVIPQAAIVEEAFNKHLFEDYGLQLRFEPERHEVMQQYELAKAEKLAMLIGTVYTREEARDLMGLQETPTLGEFEGPMGDGQDVPEKQVSLSAKLEHILGKPEAR